MTHHVVLVPGFLGFGSLGGIEYFHGVGATLSDALVERGVQAEVHQVPTHATASIRKRAAMVYESLARLSRETSGPIHLVGHSTGGLDARLAISPSASLPTDESIDDYARIRSLVTVCTPHYGTPLASIVSGSMGRPLLRFMAMMLVFGLRRGRLPVSVALKAGAYWSRLDDFVGLDDTVVDRMYDQLFDDFNEERRKQIVDLIEQVSDDQSLLIQLTPAGCDLLNAGTGDPQDIRYGSVLTRASPLSFASFLAHRHDIYAQTLHFWFRVAYLGTSRATRAHEAPIDDARERALKDAYGCVPEGSANDGIVPTLSQLWGEIVHCASADHLDVVGHFAGAGRADFFPSASGFDQRAFESLWTDVAAFMADA